MGYETATWLDLEEKKMNGAKQDEQIGMTLSSPSIYQKPSARAVFAVFQHTRHPVNRFFSYSPTATRHLKDLALGVGKPITPSLFSLSLVPEMSTRVEEAVDIPHPYERQTTHVGKPWSENG